MYLPHPHLSLAAMLNVPALKYLNSASRYKTANTESLLQLGLVVLS
jgi:hypothetical protein